MDTKSSAELPEWLDSAVYRNHRETLDYCYRNGWFAGLVLAADSFFMTWTEEELTQEEDIHFELTDEGYEAPHLDGEDQIRFGQYYDLLAERRNIDRRFESESSDPSEILDDLETLSNNIAHGTAYYNFAPLEDGSFREYDHNVDISTSPEELIRLYESIIGVEESITENLRGNAEQNFFPEEDQEQLEFYSEPLTDPPVRMENADDSFEPVGMINTLASGMYHETGERLIGEIDRNGYTTRYNPAQPVSSVLIYNWFEQSLPPMIEEEYQEQNLNERELPRVYPGNTDFRNNEYIRLSDWVNEDTLSDLDILPRSTYANALDEPIEIIQEFEDLRNRLSHDVNFYSEVRGLEVRDVIWHGYEIMHRLSDRGGPPTNRIELFGEEAEEQRREEPYMLRAERLSRWPRM